MNICEKCGYPHAAANRGTLNKDQAEAFFNDAKQDPCGAFAEIRSRAGSGFHALAAELLSEYPEEPVDPPHTISEFGPAETPGLSAKERALIARATKQWGSRAVLVGRYLALYRAEVARDIRRLVRAAVAERADGTQKGRPPSEPT